MASSIIARCINWYRRHIHRHPAATTRREEADRARKARTRKISEERARCLMLARGLDRQRRESMG
jgi:hypothetical protein